MTLGTLVRDKRSGRLGEIVCVYPYQRSIVGVYWADTMETTDVKLSTLTRSSF